MNKFSPIVAEALDLAQAEVIKRQNTELSAEHLLYGLAQHPSSYGKKAFKDCKKEIEALLKRLPQSSSALNLDSIRPSSNFSQWMTLASSHAIEARRQEVAEQDLLRFLPKIFPDLKIDYTQMAEGNEVEEEVPSFLINLNELATQGKLDPVIGRSREIRAVMEILGRRGKNNPVLVGLAGVGKTAIVEGLAEKLVKGEVPDVLKGKTVYSLEMGALMAGTKYRGEFEERIQKLLKFVKEKNGEVILFIDEIHQLVGAGRTDGAMDAANLLKPALARGELHCIGATTPEEYRKYILNDSALERRFRQVPVSIPTKEDAIEIMMGVREKLEIHHGIKISDDAIHAAVYLSEQYIPDKNLPDKAIDLLDESSSALKLSAEAMPANLVELESYIRSKKVLMQVEKDNKEIGQEIKLMEEKFKIEKGQWEKEVLTLKRASELKNQLDRLKFDLDLAQRKQNYEEASKIKYSLLPEVERQLQEVDTHWILNREHVALVIARQTGIPVSKILKTAQDNILKLEDYLKNRVYGQTASLHEIAQTLVASHAGLTDENRPLGSFLLLGPSGVGKTETAKALTQYLFDDEKNLIRLDLSEYSEKHSVAKLIGSPAGYVGYEDGGVLTEAIRRKPYAVILFDEIEKAHPDFADILLQILDDGRLTDNKGRTVSFKNTIVILTSNSKNIERDFKPEVLGRLDAVLNYQTLDRSIMKELIHKQVLLLNERLKAKKLIVKLDAPSYEILTKQGFSEQYGARPLEAVFNRLVVRPLAHKILEGKLEPGELVFSIQNQGG